MNLSVASRFVDAKRPQFDDLTVALKKAGQKDIWGGRIHFFA
jgi:hypothetical protein